VFISQVYKILYLYIWIICTKKLVLMQCRNNLPIIYIEIVIHILRVASLFENSSCCWWRWWLRLQREGVVDRGRGCKRLSTHRSYHVSRTHADLVVFMPAVNHVEGLICRWLLWTGINACSASHFVTANAHHSPPLLFGPTRPFPSSFGYSNISEWPVVARWFVLPLCQFF